MFSLDVQRSVWETIAVPPQSVQAPFLQIKAIYRGLEDPMPYFL